LSSKNNALFTLGSENNHLVGDEKKRKKLKKSWLKIKSENVHFHASREIGIFASQTEKFLFAATAADKKPHFVTLT
jgi:hypothetical protein